ncbi:hypothetical protein F2Q69_00000530 [Brassica cretica]|uniref:Uncharacterized protein n=1 Tax=Brassica cretica TaxID=69181 RepID=A0A8S9NX10_BRACR|nr:hypothetical protein F2Q69_00000530 [Brassica cretica]
MTDNIFEGLPPPSSQQQELPNSSNPNESKDESRSPAPTLVLKSSLKRSKPAESAPDVSDYAFELKKQNFDVVLTDLTKRSNLTAPPALKSALKRSNLRLNQNLKLPHCDARSCNVIPTLLYVLSWLYGKSLFFLVNDSELSNDMYKDCASVLQRELLESNVPDTIERVSVMATMEKPIDSSHGDSATSSNQLHDMASLF